MKKKFKLLLLGLLLSSLTFAHGAKIAGTVKFSGDNSPMPGVAVMVEGSATRGVVTDHNGVFEINVSQGETLVFSFLGFKEEKIAISTQTHLEVVMNYEASKFDDLVVIGYGAVRKSDLTGSVATISSEMLQQSPAATLDQALQGKAAGVTVNANTGQPGAGAQVRIRGIGSVHGKADPLYVVDGVIVSDISFLGTNDIESIEVLKEASASAIYGSRAANGVVLITTKTGTKGEKPNITFDTYVGIQNRWKKLDLMKSHEYAETIIALGGSESEMDIFKNQGFNSWLKMYRLGNSNYYPEIKSDANPTGFDYSAQEVDWQDEVFRKNAVIQNHYLSIDGATDKSTYAVSANYFSQDGTIIGSEFERLTIRLNTSFQVRPWLKVGETLSFSTSKSRWAMNNSSSPGASILSAALAMAPWDPTHYPDGSINAAGRDMGGRISASSNFKNVTNPFSMVKHSHPNVKSERWVGSLFMEIYPIKDVVFRSNLNLDYSLNRNREFKDEYEYSSYDKSENNFLSSSMSRYNTLAFENTLTYTKEFDKHRVTAMVGQTLSEYNYYSISGSGSNIQNPVSSNWYLSKVTDNKTMGDGVDRARMASFLGRVNYVYDDKYLFTFNFRADGSDKFPENRWGYFPSLSGAWRIDQEQFMENVRNVNMLKIRLGWGRLGNDAVPTASFLQTMFANGPTFVDYPFGPTADLDKQPLSPGAAVLTYINRGGKWEVSENWNLGVDFGFFNNKLTGSVDAFIRDTKEMILTVKGPAHIGNRYDAMANVGKLRNKGIELTLDYSNFFSTSKGQFNYSITGNMSYLHNELVALKGGDPVWGTYTKSDVRMALFSFWGYKYKGIYRSEEEIENYIPNQPSSTQYQVGDAKYWDKNNDGMLDDQSDMTVLGNPFPKISYGVNLAADWMGFDLQMFFQGVGGNKIYNAVRLRTEGLGLDSKLSTKMRNVWTPSNPNGNIPNPKHSLNRLASSRYIEDGSYLRLKTLQIGYSLPEAVVKKLGIGRLRVYVSANNLFTVTNYSGYDPEVGGGVDWGNYPQSRTFMIGANINF